MKVAEFAGIGLAVLLGISLACAGGPQQKAPNFALKTMSGQTIELAKLKGKVVVVNFWATWCGPCRKEIPGFMEVYKQYRENGVEIVGVSLDRNGWDVVKPYVTRAEINYPVVVGDGNLADAYGGISAIPTTFLVDKEGNIVKRHIGYLSREDLESELKALL